MSTSPPSWLPSALMAAGFMLLLWVLLRRYRMIASARRNAPEPAERLADIRDAAAQRNELSGLMVDVEELARRFAAQLDNKAERLEQLIARADERISRLERLEGGGGIGGGAAPVRRPSEQVDASTREIYRLADEGRDPVEIAREVGQHTGKVELILALREG